MYEDFQSEIHKLSQFDTVSVKITVYLGKVNMTRMETFKEREQLTCTDQSRADKILLDSREKNSSMSKTYYIKKTLHGLHKFNSKDKVIDIGNVESGTIIFVIPNIFTIQDQTFEIYTMFSEIPDSVDLVLGDKNIQFEAALSMRDLKLMFLNRSIPVFLSHKEMIKPK